MNPEGVAYYIGNMVIEYNMIWSHPDEHMRLLQVKAFVCQEENHDHD